MPLQSKPGAEVACKLFGLPPPFFVPPAADLVKVITLIERSTRLEDSVLPWSQQAD